MQERFGMSLENPGTFIAAVVQDGSVFLDREASVHKTITLARQAAAQGARLVLFPEAFIAGYPRGLSFGAIVGSRSAEGRKLYRRYVESAITIPGPEAAQLAATAADLGIYLAAGVIERDQRTAGTLYCTLAVWGPDGTLLNLHRKIKPTASERLIWGEGDGSGLRTIPTELGRVGGLICWENYMPLARSALYAQGRWANTLPARSGTNLASSTRRSIRALSPRPASTLMPAGTTAGRTFCSFRTGPFVLRYPARPLWRAQPGVRCWTTPTPWPRPNWTRS
jgi:nitrilase